MKEKHPSEPRKFKAIGGPMDGVKFRHYPDSTITKNGKVWNFNDVYVSGGKYVIEEKTMRWEQTGK